MDLKEVAAEALKEVLTTIKETKGFVLEQAPDLAKEIVRNAKASAVYNMVVGLLVFIPCAIYLSGILSLESEMTGRQCALTVVCGLLGFASGLGTLCTIESIISLVTAPKMYILKEISKALGKAE